jgi:hypothetical protein
MAGHQQVAGVREFGVHLRDEAGHDHGVHVGPRDQDSMDDVRRSQAQRDAAALRHRDAPRHEHELRRDDSYGDAATCIHRRSEVLLGELTREVQRLGIDPLDVARRIYALGQRREDDDAEDCGDEHTHPECPQQFGAENSPLARFGRSVGHGYPTGPRGRKTKI